MKKQTTKKKKNRRNKSKYPALKPHLNLRTRYELVDYDYVKKLSPEEKEWLNKFTEEYIHDNLDRKDLENNLHNTEELKKDCDDRNNARNRCILTRSKASGSFVDIDEVNEFDASDENTEDQLIEKIELDNLQKAQNRKHKSKSGNKS